MSGDLVKRLRSSMWGQPLPSEAADRIEELEAKLGEYNLLWQAYDRDPFQMYVDANEARIDAEAKLAEAVEALAYATQRFTKAEIELGKGHTDD